MALCVDEILPLALTLDISKSVGGFVYDSKPFRDGMVQSKNRQGKKKITKRGKKWETEQ